MIMKMLKGFLILPMVLGFLSCSNPASSTPTSPNTTTPGTTTPGTTTPADSSKIGFEGTGLTAFTTVESDVTGGTMGMTFAYDSTQKTAGQQSLKITGTSQKNAYSTDFFGEIYINMADSSINLSPVDFTGKTVSCSVYIPLASGISYVNLTLINTSDKQELLNQIAVTPGQWNTLNFVCSAGNVNYADPGATFTGIQKLRLRFETGTASAALAANIDAINW